MTGADSEARLTARRLAALHGCDRILSHARLSSQRQRLQGLLDAADGLWDLDGPPDTYGDGVVEALERRVAALLDMPAAAFFPSGVMAQQAALRAWADAGAGPVVAVHALAHTERRELDALSVLAGLRPIRVTTEPRPILAQDIRGAAKPFGAVVLELPLRDAGFVLPTWDELVEVTAAARERGAKVHFDGARLWESTVRLGRTLPEIAALADSVYVSFYKSLEGLSGAALAGPADLIAAARAWRTRYGGQIFQQFPAALSALAGLDRILPRLPAYVAKARVVADTLHRALGDMPGAHVHPRPPHTHQFQLWAPYPAAVLEEAGLRQAEETRTALFGKWREPGPPGLSMTEVTVAESALAWDETQILEAVGDFLARLPAPSTREA